MTWNNLHQNVGNSLANSLDPRNENLRQTSRSAG